MNVTSEVKTTTEVVIKLTLDEAKLFENFLLLFAQRPPSLRRTSNPLLHDVQKALSKMLRK
jgi:lipid II:glycine glycyltransferase (peptidoglycan interpeptide bridge formation enzyme)